MTQSSCVLGLVDMFKYLTSSHTATEINGPIKGCEATHWLYMEQEGQKRSYQPSSSLPHPLPPPATPACPPFTYYSPPHPSLHQLHPSLHQLHPSTLQVSVEWKRTAGEAVCVCVCVCVVCCKSDRPHPIGIGPVKVAT